MRPLPVYRRWRLLELVVLAPLAHELASGCEVPYEQQGEDLVDDAAWGVETAGVEGRIVYEILAK